MPNVSSQSVTETCQSRPRTIDRRFAVELRLLAGLFIPLAAMIACRGPGDSGGSERPRNLLLIVVDTLRADRIGFMGGERPTSPRIAALAEAGAWFSKAHANSPWTVPSTATLVTSRYPSEHGAEIPGDVRNLGETPPQQMGGGAISIAQILQERGFRCGLFSANPFLFGRFKDGHDVTVVERQPATPITDLAISYVRSTGEAPFFIHLQYMDLHQPLEPPQPYFDLFPTPDTGPRDERHREWAYSNGENLDTRGFRDFRANRLALYDGALRYVDHEIGRLLDALQEMGRLDETLVVVTSDHGEEFWDHASLGARLGGDPRGFFGIGHGHSMFQELLRIPLVFTGPGVKQGLQIHCLTSLLDVAPTVLDLLGVPVPEAMRGETLAPLIDGDEPVAMTASKAIYAESPAYGPAAWSLIDDGWKLITRADNVELLFHLAEDPAESTDLSSTEPDRLASMRERMVAIRQTLIAAGTTTTMVVDESTEEQLRALGYLD